MERPKPHPAEKRQLIVDNEPLHIADSKDGERISIGVGGMTELGEITKESLGRIRAARQRSRELWHPFEEGMTTVLDEMWESSEKKEGKDDFYRKHRAEAQRIALERDPELARSREENRAELKAAMKSGYEFSESLWKHGKDTIVESLYAGKEGVLIYEVVDSVRVKRELNEVRNWPFGHDPRMERSEFEKLCSERQVVLNEILEKLEAVEQVADINQVEVRSSQRGKGHAKRLLEAARWDIEQTKGIGVTIARVLENNPSGKRMLELFQKSGFELFYRDPTRFDGSMAPSEADAYWIAIRINE
jgi:GNAT superfamily N-acetyltransferase